MANNAHSTAPIQASDIHVVDQSKMKKALRATLLGNFMEWFDIGVFSYVMTYITLHFFPLPAPWDGLATFATLAVTFLVRPLGGLILGPLGDRVGRKAILAFTIIMMSLGTFLIGCLPTYQQIGVAAPVLLILLKFIQGFSTGGEYAGAATFIAEYASDKRRGFWGSFLDLGSYLGFAAAAGLVTVLELATTDAQMESWGWRIAFWVALPLGLIGLYMRSNIDESHAFEAVQESREERVGDTVAASGKNGGAGASGSTDTSLKGQVSYLFRNFWPQILMGSALVMCAQVVGYALTTFMPTYLTDTLGYDTVHGNALLVPVLIIVSVGLPLFGSLSDRIGRRPVMIAGCAVGVVFAIPAFALMMMDHVWSTLAGLMIIGVIMMFQVSIQASALPSLFPTASRYTAMGLMFNIAVALFGGTTGFVITALQSVLGTDYAGAYYIMFACIVGSIGVYCMRESAGRNLLGSMPVVDEKHEVTEVLDGIEDNEKYDLSTMPIEDAGVGAGDRAGV
ncbi:MFS transporter [uncultured Corynebacterium sp.]|uniref:MFS transporter n=1 Tax=uncultured Corynebacterium sp. TaxID=159447 RepID=UPI0025CC3B82|nr:MFS transporter [uncultured Corynebacterium sp.]